MGELECRLLVSGAGGVPEPAAVTGDVVSVVPLDTNALGLGSEALAYLLRVPLSVPVGYQVRDGEAGCVVRGVGEAVS